MSDRVPVPILVGVTGIEVTSGMLRLLRDTDAAGVCLLRRNVESPAQLRELVSGLRAELGRPLLVAIDHDGGRRCAFSGGVTFFPGFPALAATGNPGLAREAGRAIGRELVRMGIDLNLAPVGELGILGGAYQDGAADEGLLTAGSAGVSVTEDLTGPALRGGTPLREGVTGAFQAGKDLCLLLHDEALIREAAQIRRTLGGGNGLASLLVPRAPSVAEDGEESDAAGELAEAIAAASVKVERDPLHLLPLDGTRRVGVILPRLAEVAHLWTIESDPLQAWLPAPSGRTQVLEVPVEPEGETLSMPLDWAAAFETVVLFCLDAHRFPAQRLLLEELQRRCPRVVAVLLGGPEDRGFVGEKSSLVMAWGFRLCQLEAARSVLYPA